MLINLKSHINMKHTQTTNETKEEKEKKNVYQERKGWTISDECVSLDVS